MTSWPIFILKAATTVFSLALAPAAFPAVVPLLSVPEWKGDLNADAKLEEPCYRITWIDAKGPRPDFHVAESFGEIVLQPSSQRTRTEK